ncbi:hypothetical protein A2U01_0078979, partial [Trifolium medium]|nr:hypothetical protein [Trifolium medium]
MAPLTIRKSRMALILSICSSGSDYPSYVPSGGGLLNPAGMGAFMISLSREGSDSIPRRCHVENGEEDYCRVGVSG